ncbi:MAG TPA: GyrI-like domain-containing protein [Prolixibacteraceae bacterium]|nr:GyrI-like domain-containing protein [Prolixibacteraceae bacterium]
MQPQIKTIGPKKLLGVCRVMSLAENQTGELWRSFMPRLKEIETRVGNELFSLQVYDEDYFQQFDPLNEFEKWALAEVRNFSVIPDEMEPFELPGGLYAVFQHKGMGTEIFQHIFSAWLPNSDFQLDDRPHFEVLGEKYKQGSADSEEEIWVPVKSKD